MRMDFFLYVDISIHAFLEVPSLTVVRSYGFYVGENGFFFEGVGGDGRD